MAKRTKSSGKPKKWFPVIVPSMFKEQVIGEMPSLDISKLLNKKISINLMSVTRDFRQQDVNLTFIINSISGQTAQASLTSYKLSPSSMKRLIRRKTDRIDARVEVSTRGGQQAVMKLVIVTLNNTFNNVRTKVRNAAVKQVKLLANKFTLVELTQQLTVNRFQKELKLFLNKLYPIRYIVVRELSLIGDAPKPEEAKPKEAAEEPAEKSSKPSKAEESKQPAAKKPTETPKPKETAEEPEQSPKSKETSIRMKKPNKNPKSDKPETSTIA